jgi:anaerobic selenocysteine-containing dehydrogenase
MMFPQPAVDLTRAYGSPGHRDRFRSRVRGLPEFGNELPVSTLADEILVPGEGRVRALITFAGNPVLSTPNGRRLDEALASLEFMVSVDLYINETTRHAHLVLPPTGPLEHSHYDIALSGFAVRNVAKYSPPLFEKPEGAWHDHEILSELSLRLGTRPGMERLQASLKSWVVRGLGPDRMLAFMLRGGPYGKGSPHRLSLARLRKSPNGIDLGPLQPNVLSRLKTADRRIKLAPEMFLRDLDRAHQALREPVPSLSLIGRRHVRSNNSWLHNSHRLVKGKPRCTLLMHPQDASARGIVEGAIVRVGSRVGEVEVPVELTEDIRPGVVSLPHGWGHDRKGARLRVAGLHAGASINDLVDDQRLDVLTGTAVLNGTPVEVHPLAVVPPVEQEIRTPALS